MTGAHMGAAVTATSFKALEDKVCEHDKWIDGTNGVKGAKSRLDLIEKDIGDINTNIGEIKNSIKSFTNWAIRLFVAVVSGVAIWFFTDVLPNLPVK